MNRIEEELGLISDEQQRQIDELIDRPDGATEDYLLQFKRAVQIDISISSILSELNQQEKPVVEESIQAILSIRKLARGVIFDRWTILRAVDPLYDKSEAKCIMKYLSNYNENGCLDSALVPAQSLQEDTGEVIKAKSIDLQAVTYSRKYLGFS